LSEGGLDREVVEGLRKSIRVLRPVYPIVKSKATGRVVDGLHRYEASPAVYRKHCVELEMSERDEVLYRLHLNYRRKVSRGETQKQLVTLAGMLEKEGVTREQMVSRLAEITPFTDRYVRELLPDEYKMVERAPREPAAPPLIEGAKPGPAPPPAPDAELVPHIERPEPSIETRVYKPKEPWEARLARMKVPISRMDEAVAVELQRLGVAFESQKQFCVQSTTCDVYLPEIGVAIYLDGEEAHRGREERDTELREMLANRLGVRVVSVPYRRFSDSEVKRVMEAILEVLPPRDEETSTDPRSSAPAARRRSGRRAGEPPSGGTRVTDQAQRSKQLPQETGRQKPVAEAATPENEPRVFFMGRPVNEAAEMLRTKAGRRKLTREWEEKLGESGGI